jgi:mono/diheme cytochrome c family protein
MMSPMQSSWLSALLAVASLFSSFVFAGDKIELKDKKQSSQDLELVGDLPGLPPDSVRFITYEQLNRLPQVDFKVTDDFNFHGPMEIGGVYLDEILKALNIPDKGTLIAADCDDEYQAHYTDDYRHAHRPILVLRLNGKPPAQFPRTRDDGTYGPYLVSHASFTPRYHVLAHADEPQIPNGVVELRFLKQDAVLDAIRPHGSFAEDSPEMQGYQIAQQNCFRCHNEGDYGGHKAGRSWSALARIAQASPQSFEAYTKDPQSQDETAEMPGNPEYDDATLHALTAYFRTFAPPAGPATK